MANRCDHCAISMQSARSHVHTILCALEQSHDLKSAVIFSSFKWFTSFVHVHWREVLHIIHLLHLFNTSEWEMRGLWTRVNAWTNTSWTMNYDIGWRMCTRIYIYGPSCITNYQQPNECFTLTNNILRTVNILILTPLHTALTVQVYWSNELDEADELNEVNEVESAQTVHEWSTSFSKCEVLHSFTGVK